MDNCKFSHLTDNRKAELEKLVEEKQKAKGKRKSDLLDESDPEKKLSEWLSKRYKKDEQVHNKEEEDKEEEAPLLPVYEIPPHVAQIPNPPPSILPPPPDVLRGLQFVDWG